MRSGFFSQKETKEIKYTVKLLPSCSTCKLYKQCMHGKMKPYGLNKKKILILGEAPGQEEDASGIPFIGPSGNELKKHLRQIDIDMYQDCVIYNAVNCRPPKNRKPTINEINYCRPSVDYVIEKYEPKVIIPLGESALRSLIGHRYLGGFASANDSAFTISSWIGWEIPDTDLKCWIVPNYHPSYILRQKDDFNSPALNKIFRDNLRKAVNVIEKEIKHESVKVIQLKDSKEVNKLFNKMLGEKEPFVLTYDYETTGLKPHRTDIHRIISCSICFNESYSISFLMNSNIEDNWRKILQSTTIKKTAHNMKFEEAWNRVILKTKSKSWLWDSMIAAHVLNNRKRTTSLKFQAYVRFGITDYNSHIQPFLMSTESSANGINRIDQIPTSDLLEYNGYDSLLEYRLAKVQIKEMNLPIQYFKNMEFL